MVTGPCYLEKLEQIILDPLDTGETSGKGGSCFLGGPWLLTPRILYDTQAQVSLLILVPSLVHGPQPQKMLLEGKH